METWRLIDYFDVWGNEKDGYEVNDLCISKRGITITDEATDKDILKFLVDIGYLKTSDGRKVYLEDEGDMISIYQRKGHLPLGRLEREVA